MANNSKDDKLDFLFKGVLTLSTIEDCYAFFGDLCTAAELQEMSRRMRAAQLLRQGKVYVEIAAETGLSTATISRVNRCLKYGTDGYLKVLEDVERAERRRGLRDEFL